MHSFIEVALERKHMSCHKLSATQFVLSITVIACYELSYCWCFIFEELFKKFDIHRVLDSFRSTVHQRNSLVTYSEMMTNKNQEIRCILDRFMRLGNGLWLRRHVSNIRIATRSLPIFKLCLVLEITDFYFSQGVGALCLLTLVNVS